MVVLNVNWLEQQQRICHDWLFGFVSLFFGLGLMCHVNIDFSTTVRGSGIKGITRGISNNNRERLAYLSRSGVLVRVKDGAQLEKRPQMSISHTHTHTHIYRKPHHCFAISSTHMCECFTTLANSHKKTAPPPNPHKHVKRCMQMSEEATTHSTICYATVQNNT